MKKLAIFFVALFCMALLSAPTAKAVNIVFYTTEIFEYKDENTTIFAEIPTNNSIQSGNMQIRVVGVGLRHPIIVSLDNISSAIPADGFFILNLQLPINNFTLSLSYNGSTLLSYFYRVIRNIPTAPYSPQITTVGEISEREKERLQERIEEIQKDKIVIETDTQAEIEISPLYLFLAVFTSALSAGLGTGIGRLIKKRVPRFTKNPMISLFKGGTLIFFFACLLIISLPVMDKMANSWSAEGTVQGWIEQGLLPPDVGENIMSQIRTMYRISWEGVVIGMFWAVIGIFHALVFVRFMNEAYTNTPNDGKLEAIVELDTTSDDYDLKISQVEGVTRRDKNGLWRMHLLHDNKYSTAVAEFLGFYNGLPFVKFGEEEIISQPKIAVDMGGRDVPGILVDRIEDVKDPFKDTRITSYMKRQHIAYMRQHGQDKITVWGRMRRWLAKKLNWMERTPESVFVLHLSDKYFRAMKLLDKKYDMRRDVALASAVRMTDDALSHKEDVMQGDIFHKLHQKIKPFANMVSSEKQKRESVDVEKRYDKILETGKTAREELAKGLGKIESEKGGDDNA